MSFYFPRSISYGAIGHVLGHELTHGFDDTGTQCTVILEFVLLYKPSKQIIRLQWEQIDTFMLYNVGAAS